MNPLEQENQRLCEEVAYWEKQHQEAVATGALVLMRSKDQDALITELREALAEACKWDWEMHRMDMAMQNYGEPDLVSAPVCKQIYTALHRKV